MKKAIILSLFSSLLFSTYSYANPAAIQLEQIRRQNHAAAAAASQITFVSNSAQVGFIEVDTISSQEYDRRQSTNRWKLSNTNSNYFISRLEEGSAFLKSCYFNGEFCEVLTLSELVKHYTKDEGVLFNGFSFNTYTQRIVLYYSKN